MSEKDFGRNLGPITSQRLREIDIASLDDLREIGARAAYTRLKFLFGAAVTLNALYALEAAVLGCDWRELPPEIRDDLKVFAAGLKQKQPR